jgi:hypothetical protein
MIFPQIHRVSVNDADRSPQQALMQWLRRPVSLARIEPEA